MKPSVQSSLTEDGSSTLFSEQFQAHYHSTHGAINESKHIFIQNGLDFFIEHNQNLPFFSILEYGLGTGLNAFLTALYSFQFSHSIYYTSIEAYPVPKEVINDLNYGQLLGNNELFYAIHQAPWNTVHQLTDRFTLEKIEDNFESFETTSKYHIIYFDAFSPDIQAHLWEESFLKNCYNVLETGGILVTFCAKGTFKRALKAVGFEIERLPGPPGKREMTRAIKR
jgi:tRNA U34 5-methylaminomethyl-2-thiouridine-forming methyltransferase MnmC